MRKSVHTTPRKSKLHAGKAVITLDARCRGSKDGGCQKRLAGVRGGVHIQIAANPLRKFQGQIKCSGKQVANP